MFLAGHLSDLSESKALALTRQPPPLESPSRRLRFEDETETEVQSRYLERQRRWAGQYKTSVLLSKPDLNLYVKGRTEFQQARGNKGTRQRGQTPSETLCQCDPSRTFLGSGLARGCHLHSVVLDEREQSLYITHLKLQTEPIRETYIGSVTPSAISGGGGGAQFALKNQSRRMTIQVEQNNTQMNTLQARSTTELPINPYAPDQQISPIHPSYLASPISRYTSLSSPPPSAVTSQNVRMNGRVAGKNLYLNQEELARPANGRSIKRVQSDVELLKRSSCEEEGGSEKLSLSSKTTGDIYLCLCLQTKLQIDDRLRMNVQNV